MPDGGAERLVIHRVSRTYRLFNAQPLNIQQQRLVVSPGKSYQSRYREPRVRTHIVARDENEVERKTGKLTRRKKMRRRSRYVTVRSNEVLSLFNEHALDGEAPLRKSQRASLSFSELMRNVDTPG